MQTLQLKMKMKMMFDCCLDNPVVNQATRESVALVNCCCVGLESDDVRVYDLNCYEMIEFD